MIELLVKRLCSACSRQNLTRSNPTPITSEPVNCLITDNCYSTPKSASILIVGHVARRGAELGVRLDHFVHCLEEVLLGGHFTTCTNCEHAGFGTNAANLGACKQLFIYY